MVIHYFNGIDELTEEWPKQHYRPFRDDEKCCKKVISWGTGDTPVYDTAVDNESYNTATEIVMLGAAKIAAIDARTNELILQGFDHNSKHFGLSVLDQMNWTGMYAMRSGLTFPQPASDSDGNSYSVANVAELETIAELIYDTINGASGYRTTGRTLKEAANAAVAAEDLAALKAVVDTR